MKTASLRTKRLIPDKFLLCLEEARSSGHERSENQLIFTRAVESDQGGVAAPYPGSMPSLGIGVSTQGGIVIFDMYVFYPCVRVHMSDTHVEARGQLKGVSPLLPCGFQESN